IHWSSVREERHVFFGNDLGDDAFVTMASGHFVTDRQLTLRGDVDFDGFNNAAVNAFAGFSAFDFLVILHLEIVELLFEAADDFVDLVANRRRIDFDAIVNLRQLAQERLGDLAIGWDDDFAGLAVDHVERNFFAKQNIAESFGELLAQLIGLLLIFVFYFFGV